MRGRPSCVRTREKELTPNVCERYVRERILEVQNELLRQRAHDFNIGNQALGIDAEIVKTAVLRRLHLTDEGQPSLAMRYLSAASPTSTAKYPAP